MFRLSKLPLPTKNFEKHLDAPPVVEILQYRELLGEWARHQTHRSAHLHFVGELQLPPRSAAEIRVSTTPRGTGCGCSPHITSRDTPKVPLILRH
jgi:hypothetical protein